MPDAPTISVIIPAYNCAGTIPRTIQAVISQHFSAQIEIIVVDDGSTDQTAQVIQFFSQVKYIRQDNSGPAAARNRGARESKGSYLFFTDSDCVPQPDWVAKMMPHFQDENVGVVAGSYGIANPENRLARCIHQEILYRHHVRMPQFPSYFGSFNFAVRRKIFEKVGGFDPSYRNASGEDNDLSYKIVASGSRIYFAKDALVDHFHTGRLQKYLREQGRHGFWRVKMYLRHPRMGRGDDYTFWKDIAEIPVAFLILGCAGIGLFASGFLKISFFLLVGVVGVEVYYAIIMTKDFWTGLFWAYVMLLRSGVRALGLLAGLAVFFRFRSFKK